MNKIEDIIQMYISKSQFCQSNVAIFQNHHYYTLLWESKGSSTDVMMPYDDAIDAVEGEI